MTKPLLGLVMIVKNEAARIRETLDSVKPYVDRWSVLDTGSTDGTQEIAHDVLHDVPGALYEEPFVDFATSRNRVLEIAAKGGVGVGKQEVRGWWFEEPAEFTLMLSGDETLHGGEALREFLESKRDAPDGAYSVEMRSGPSRWFYPRILRTGAGWRYHGAVHEVPLGPNGKTHGPVVPGVHIEHKPSDPERRARRIREFDLPTLQKLVDDESVPLSERAQAVWFLAQTYETIADDLPRESGGAWVSHKMAALALYRRRVEIDGEDQLKARYAEFKCMNIAEQLGLYTDEEMVRRLEGFLKVEKQIPEVRYMLAAHGAAIDVEWGLVLAEDAAREARWAAEHPATHLPLDTRVEWLSLRLAAECARLTGKRERMRRLAKAGVEAGGPTEKFEEYLK